MKRIACFLIATLFAFGGVGCASGNSAYTHKAGAPDYSQADGVLLLDSWIPPQASDEGFATYADCGYNMLHCGVTSLQIGGEGGIANEQRKLEDNFAYAQKHGLKVIISMNALNMNQRVATPLRYLDTRIGTVLEKWKDNDTFYGYMPYDEPFFDRELDAGNPDMMQKGYDRIIDYIRDEYLYFSSKYPGKAFEIVTLGKTINPITANYGKSFGGDFDAFYNFYEDNFLKLLPYDERIVSFDAYPFNTDERDGSLTLYRGFVSSLEALGYRAENLHAAEKGTYIQNHHTVYNTAQILWQYYTAMAYGYTHFTTYCYREEWGNKVFSLSERGEKTANWYYFQKAHNEIKSFENVYMQFADGWQGAMTFDGTERVDEDPSYKYCTRQLKSYDGLKSVTSTQDTLVGIMKDKNGYDGYLITNQAVPRANTGSTVEATFNGATHAVVYADGKSEVRELQNGKLTLDLKAGGGAFAVPYMEK